MRSRDTYIIIIIAATLVVSLVAVPVTADVSVEYIGHASFIVETEDGIRVVLDPFSSTRWLGYHYPSSVDADAVLVTHPHYDHDASYYWGDSVPVFREPGEYRVGDARIVGIEGKHADPYGKEFAQKNTIWLVEAGGVRIVHVGDNGPLTAANVLALGKVDVLMVPADGDDHILKPDEIQAAREALGDPLVVPMHYRLEGFLGLPQSLGPVDPWLAKQRGVVRLDGNRTTLTSERVPGREVLVFQHSPELEVWDGGLSSGWEFLAKARSMMESQPSQSAEASALVKKAADGYDTIVFGFQWGRVLARSGKTAEATSVLEAALAGAGRDDWEHRMRARTLLAELYAAEGRRGEAEAQYRIVLENSYRTELLEQARAFLAR